MKKNIFFSLTLIGLTAISSEIILVREFLTVFYGNELSIGFLLFVWLMGGALGAAAGSFFYRIKEAPSGALTEKNAANLLYSETALSLLIPASLALAKITRIIFGIGLGELVCLPVMLVWSLACIMPVSAVLGFMFVTGCYLYKAKEGALEKKIAGAYFLESVGALAGGFLTTVILVRCFHNLEIAFFLSILNLTAANLLARTFLAEQRVLKLSLAILLLTFIIFSLGPVKMLDERLSGLKWRGATLIKNEDSIYGNVALARIAGQYTFFSNGLYMLSAPDKATAEEKVHFAMLSHPDPKSVLLIGGGAGEELSEILKYPVDKIIYVELDPLIIKMAKIYLNREPWYRLDNPRVNIINTDARFYVKTVNEKFDAALICLPDPYTAQINRFYTREFYEELKRILNDNGIVSFGVLSSENYISPEQAEFLRSLYATLNEVYPDVKIIPGDTAFFLASPAKNTIDLDYNKLEKKRARENIETYFIRPFYLFSKLSKDRISYMDNLVGKGEGKIKASINTDFNPISYYHDMVLWSAYQSFKVSRFFDAVRKLGFRKIFAAACIVLAILVSLAGKKTDFKNAAVLFSLGTTGFSEMAFQLVIMLTFQIFYGYLYYKIGLIFTAFMAGLAAGTFFILRRLDSIKKLYNTYIKIQASVLVYPLALLVIFKVMSATGASSGFGAELVFTSLPFIAGFVGGVQFAAANKLYLKGSGAVRRAAGITYASDLAGSCAGAILVSAFMIPLTGVYGTCISVVFLNLLAFILLLFGKRASQTCV